MSHPEGSLQLWPIIGHIEFDQVEHIQRISLPETTYFVFSNGLAIWDGLSDIRHIKVNYGRYNRPF